MTHVVGMSLDICANKTKQKFIIKRLIKQVFGQPKNRTKKKSSSWSFFFRSDHDDDDNDYGYHSNMSDVVIFYFK